MFQLISFTRYPALQIYICLQKSLLTLKATNWTRDPSLWPTVPLRWIICRKYSKPNVLEIEITISKVWNLMIRGACIFNAVQTLKLHQRGEQHREETELICAAILKARHWKLKSESQNDLAFNLEEKEPSAKNWSVQKVGGCLYCRRQTSGKQRTMSGQLTAQETLEVQKWKWKWHDSRLEEYQVVNKGGNKGKQRKIKDRTNYEWTTPGAMQPCWMASHCQVDNSYLCQTKLICLFNLL